MFPLRYFVFKSELDLEEVNRIVSDLFPDVKFDVDQRLKSLSISGPNDHINEVYKRIKNLGFELYEDI